MVLPMIVAAQEATKIISGMGQAAQQSFFTFRYRPKRKWWDNNIPEGIIITVPAWVAVFLILTVGVVGFIVFMDQILKGLEKLGIKKPKTSLPVSFGDIMGGMFNPFQGAQNLWKLGGGK